MGAGSQGLLPTDGVFDTDMVDADVDKQEPVDVEVDGPDTDFRVGATPADEDLVPTDEVADNKFGVPGFSC